MYQPYDYLGVFIGISLSLLAMGGCVSMGLFIAWIIEKQINKGKS